MSDAGRRGRPLRPIDPASPAAEFADGLRELADRAGMTYQRLAAATGLSKSTWSRALSGNQVPSWGVVQQFLTAVGTGDPRDVEAWRQRWSSVAHPSTPVRVDVRFDPVAPVFYLGYAHPDRPVSEPVGPARLVERLHGDLTDSVGELLGLRAGRSAGFVDLGLRSGERWQEEMLQAIGNCQVYVPLLSARYLASSWCRFEWEAVSSRTIRSRSGEPTDVPQTVVPLLWTPLDRATLPPAIRRVQLFAPSPAPPDVLESYLSEGLYGLMVTHREAEYRVVVWRLAQRIVNTVMRYELEPGNPAVTDGLGPSFVDADRG